MNAEASEVIIPADELSHHAIFTERLRRIERMRRQPKRVPGMRRYYQEHIAEFINDWGITIDPRVIKSGKPAIMPFLLYPRQRQWLDWLYKNWRDGEYGLTEKSRDVGISWLAMAFSCSMCVLFDDMAIGMGSFKEDKVDKVGDPGTLFYKGRAFLSALPREFRGGWNADDYSSHMRLILPETGSSIIGEVGDNIGRGSRTSIYLVDETAHLEHGELADQALSATTDCRQDMSSVCGMGNTFAERAHSGKVRKFTFHWRDDPRKNDAWHAAMIEKWGPVTVAQECDINYSASVENIVIPSAWVQAAVDAHRKLGLSITGLRRAALDVADRGIDRNALAFRHGILLEHVESWSGATMVHGREWDLYDTTERAFNLCDAHDMEGFDYDADGVGANVRGDARKINEKRAKDDDRQLTVRPFRGSGKVHDPEKSMIEGRKNKDFFANFKAQSWWHLRSRFQATYRAVNGLPYRADELISIAPDIPELARLLVELSQPVYTENNAGKLLIDKQPDGVASPNLADAVMEAFAPRRPPMLIHDALLEDDHATEARD